MPSTMPTATASAISQPRSVKMPGFFGSLGMLLDRTRRTYPNQTSTEVVWRVSVYREGGIVCANLIKAPANVGFERMTSPVGWKNVGITAATTGR